MTVLSTLACTISAAGCSRPSYADIYETLQAAFKSIYGGDAYIAPDSQDGQLLAIFAKGQDDANAATQAAYASFSPATAQGSALSSNVKINGIARAVPSNSSVDLTIIGNVGTTITNGVAQDTSGQNWLLPSSVTIPSSGSIVVTAAAATAGAVTTAPATVTRIQTPTLGWQSVSNVSAASPGAAIETDAALRQRQAVSTSLPSRTVLDGILGAVLALVGVTQAKVYENDTNATDANGLPAHSIAGVILGGDNTQIANTLLLKKAPGVSTQGTTSIAVTDPAGIGPYTIKFYRPTNKRIIMALTVKAATGYTTATGAAIQAAIIAYVNGLGIGKKVDWGKLFIPAQLYGTTDYGKFEIDAITIAAFGGTLAATDVAIAFNEIANLALADITMTVT